MPRASEPGRSRGARVLASGGLIVGACLAGGTAVAVPSAGCNGAPGEKPVYLTFDTGHMAIAPLVAEVLDRHGVKATFFLANERTKTGGSSLDDTWAPWWQARAREGHLFGSHTWDHDVWQADLPSVDGMPRFRVRPTQGPAAGRVRELDRAALCAELARPSERFRAVTGQTLAPIWRAPGGKTSPALLAAAEACGWRHVPWTAAGFLGDELPSDRFPNPALLNQALRTVQSGDILLAHLGIWSRQEPWAPAVLEPLIVGLRERGLCFATLRDHPRYRAALAGHPR
jgi:peptidoglycan-N-acetylmuramic acid deacetylase